MVFFNYREGQLYAEDVPLYKIADQIKTPVYCYSAYARAAVLPGIIVQGIDLHIGSQLTEIAPFEQAFDCLAELTTTLRDLGHEISVLDIGGGLGISYDDEGPQPPELADYAALAGR